MNGVPTVAISGVPDPLPEGLAVVDVREPVEWSTATSRARCTSRCAS